ncbi:hypothetical protein [Chlorogloeopsis sp. ULAP02]|uniref:hypothetical protein n=1 Tax=Chlorogloeopsis sp. ULAP02 TaxID=3107926 RepID=UPI003136868A
MDVQLIKVIEKPILKKEEEPEQQNFSSDTINTQQPTVDAKQVLNDKYNEPNYTSVRYYPLVQSVGNSGWQVSEIWRDIRIDSFC